MRAAWIAAVQRSRDRKQSLRITRLFGLIDGTGIERHRHWVRLVDAGIMKLAVDQNCNWNQRRLAILRELQHAHSPRPLNIFLRLLLFGKLFLSSLLRPLELRSVLGLRGWGSQREKPENDDDGRP
jgi:hypothetical protein